MSSKMEPFASRTREAERLGQVGAVMWNQNLFINVILPKDLADVARAAWERDDEGDATKETAAQADERSQAGHLALIGLAVEERGISLEDASVQVALHAWQVGAALEAADSRGLLPE